MHTSKMNHKIVGLLVFLFLAMFVTVYAFLHAGGHKNFNELRYYISAFSIAISILCWFSSKELAIRLPLSLMSLAFLYWMLSLELRGNGTFFLLNVFILSPQLLQMWLFIIFLCVSVYMLMRPYVKYRFLCVCSISVVVFLALGLSILPKASLAYLENSYQIAPVIKIAKLQQKKGGYYSPLNAEYQYKLALYRVRKPDIITIGTSRVLGFHQYMFNVPFVNMGRTLGDFAQIKIFERLLAIHKPKIIIWGLDWWDFLQKTNYHWHYENDNGTHIIPSRLLLPYQWIFNGKITLQQFIDTALNKKSPGIDNNSYGVPARHHIGGFSKDGSYYYFSQLSALPGVKSTQLSNVIKTIEEKNPTSSYFKQGNHIPEYKWRLLKKITNLLKKNHVELIVYLAPEPPLIVDAMNRTNHYDYINEARSKSAKRLDHFYDFFDPRVLASTNCEFQDALHSGSIVSMRILLALSKDKKSHLYKYIRKRKIRHLIAKYHGRVDIPLPGMGEYAETDFLGLQCKKGRPISG